MTDDDVIERAARFACTARPGHDHQPRLDQECAWVLAVCENLADAGLLARPFPAKGRIEELALELLERSHETPFPDDAQGLSEARAWAQKIATDLLPTRDEIADVIYGVFTTQYGDVMAFDNAADAVLALLKGTQQ